MIILCYNLVVSILKGQEKERYLDYDPVDLMVESQNKKHQNWSLRAMVESLCICSYLNQKFTGMLLSS